MKYVLTITLLFSLVFSQVGYYFVKLALEEECKEEAEEQMLKGVRQEDMTAISYADNRDKIYWEEEGREFMLDGQLYDVIKTGTVDGNEVLYCLADKKEKDLIDQYSLLTKKVTGNAKKQKQAPSFAIQLFFYEKDIAAQHIFSAPPVTNGMGTKKLAHTVLDIVIPPPELV